MATATRPLTERQADILRLLKDGAHVKDIAATLGTSENNIYQTRRRLIDAGHLPKPRKKSGRKSTRKVASSAPRRVVRTNGSEPVRPSIPADLDPVTVIRARIDTINAEVGKLSTLVTEATAQLEAHGDEAKRLTKALHALEPGSNGSSRKPSARSRR